MARGTKITAKEQGRRALARAVRLQRHAHDTAWQARRALMLAFDAINQVAFCNDAKRLEAFLKGEIEILKQQGAQAYALAGTQRYQMENLAEMLGLDLGGRKRR